MAKSGLSAPEAGESGTMKLVAAAASVRAPSWCSGWGRGRCWPGAGPRLSWLHPVPATGRLSVAPRRPGRAAQAWVSAQMPTAKQISATTSTGTATFGDGPGRFAGDG